VSFWQTALKNQSSNKHSLHPGEPSVESYVIAQSSLRLMKPKTAEEPRQQMANYNFNLCYKTALSQLDTN
jgi:hypothetical protein